MFATNDPTPNFNPNPNPNSGAVQGLNLLFNPFLFLNKFKEIEPEKPMFPKFAMPLAQLQLAPVSSSDLFPMLASMGVSHPHPSVPDHHHQFSSSCPAPSSSSCPAPSSSSSSSSCSSSSLSVTAPPPLPPPPALLQSREFHDSLLTLLKRTMPATAPEEQGALLTRLFLCENPFEDFAAIMENHLSQNCQNQNIDGETGIGGITGILSGLMTPLNDKWIGTSLTISALMAAERKVQTFFGVTRMFRNGFLEQFGTLKELIQHGDNLITNAEQYTEPFHIVWDESTMYDMDSPLLRKHVLLLMDLVTFVELFKMMPVFAMLDVQDQICLINHLAVVLLGFCERYHSARWRAETVVKLSNGFCPIFIFYKNAQFAGEEAKVDLIFRKAMKPFNRLQLTTEEYLLLRAIIMSHSAATGLSVQAQRLLHKEAERHAHALLQFLQAQHGEQAGAWRYAEMLALVENVFHIAAKHRALHAHAARAERGKGRMQEFPAAFREMCVGGGQQKEQMNE